MITERNPITGRVKITRGNGTIVECVPFSTKTNTWTLPFWVPRKDTVYSRDQYYVPTLETQER